MLNNNFKKEDLIKSLSTKTGFPYNYSKKIIDDLIEVILQGIKNGYFNLKNVGSFKIIHKNERLGRNPKTKEEFIIAARKSVKYTPSKKIVEKLNDII